MKVTTVLFDIGGVLSHDGHETYLTHEVYGLALGLGLPKEELFQKVAPIFRKYAVLAEANESDFWNEIGHALEIELTPDAIVAVKEQIKTTNPEATSSLELLRDKGVKVGIISNCTPFFYPVQAKLLALDEYIEPSLLFLSHEQGCLKSGGLFEVAASRVDPSQTLIIEDRLKNVEYAQKLGFGAVQYSMESGGSLLALISRIVDQYRGRQTGLYEITPSDSNGA